MLFSNIFVPAVAVLGVTSSVLANPVAQPASAAIEARQDQPAPDSLLGILQTLQQGLNSAVADINNAASTGSDVTTSMNTVEGLFNSASTQLQGLGPDAAAAAAPTDLISTLLGIVTSVLSLVLSPLTGGSSNLLSGLLGTVLSLVTGLVPGLLKGVLGGLLGGL